MIVYFDIETLPCDKPELIADIAKSINPPGTIKKQESIEKWMNEEYAKKVAEAVNKTSFDGMYGRIACISWAFDDGEINSTNSYSTEEEVISDFYDALSLENHSVFCGHNIYGFDLPFLKHRSMILGLRPPQILFNAMYSRNWDRCIADTMLMWSSDRQNHISMDKLCKAFGISGKGDFDGSMVAETWPVNPQKVIDYCVDDVHRTREIYKRLTFSN